MQSVKPAILFFVLAMFVLAASATLLFWPTVVKKAEAQPDNAVTEVPRYKILESAETNGMRGFEVATSAKSEAAMRLVAEDLQEEYVPEDGTLLIEFSKLRDPSENTGFALVFDNKRAILDANNGETSATYDESYDRDEARHIMRDEGGVRVVSFQDFAEENPGVWDSAEKVLN